MIARYKNIDNIKLVRDQIRAQRIDVHDKALFYFNKKKLSSFTSNDLDTIEISIYDLDDNLLYWQDIGLPNYEIVNSNIILRPGDDLRDMGFTRGEYRVIYSFFRNIIGSSERNDTSARNIAGNENDYLTKLYIEEISPSRKEIRVLPVKTGISDVDRLLQQKFVDFTEYSVAVSELKSLVLNRLSIYDFNRDNIDTSSKSIASVGETLLRNKWTQIVNSVRVQWSNFADDVNVDDILLPSTYISFLGLVVTEAVQNVYPTQARNNAEVFGYIKNRIMLIGTPSIREFSNDYRILSHVINFGQDKNYLIANWIRDDIKYPNFPYSTVFKLYEPLPEDIKAKTQLWVSKEISLPVVNKVFLHGFETPDVRVSKYLRGANFDITIDRVGYRSTPFESWDAILSSNPTTSQQLVDHYFSGSLSGIDINEGFADYQNFVNFGSAEERLANFKYKVEIIEGYDSVISSRSDISGSASHSEYVLSDITSFNIKKSNLIAGFDTYEKFLYETSGTQYSASVHLSESVPYNIVGEWPKQNTTRPYILYSATSSEVNTWYDTQSAIAQRFDINNSNRLVNNIPNHLQVDSGSREYIEFVDMIGQYYDLIYTYIVALNKLHDRDENILEGLSKDLTFNVVKSFGFDLQNGNDYVDLWKYAFGTDDSGLYEQTGSIHSQPYGDITKEIWRRILNNLPYLLKTKGTIRSVKALLNCYGIPSSILAVREYGGPDPFEFPTLQDKSSFIFEDFVYSLDFKGGQSVEFPWTFSPTPSTLEITFKTTYTSSPTMSIVNAETNWGISLITSGTRFEEQLGYIQFQNSSTIVTSSRFGFYDDDFYTIGVMVESGSQTTHSLYVKSFESDRIIFSSTMNVLSGSSAWSSASTAYVGGDGVSFGDYFSGSVMEFRLFNPVISESVYDNHVRWPKSYNSNMITSSFDDVVLRYSFDDPRNHSIESIVTDIRPNQEMVTPGTASGFFNEINYTPFTKEFASLIPGIGMNRFVSNKVRIEDNGIERGTLSPTERVEVSQFDKSPLDSNRLGIYFSPVDVLNRDIIGTFAGADLANYIGDPQYIYNEEYTKLKELHKFYFQKFSSMSSSIDYNTFIRVLKNYDVSLFEQLKSLLPIRANSTIGILIEPLILERNKEKFRPMTKELNHYSGSIDTGSLVLCGVKESYETEIRDLYLPNLTSSTIPLNALTNFPHSTGSTDYEMANETWKHQSIFVGTINPLWTTTSSFVEPLSQTKEDSGSFLSKILEELASDRRLRYEGTLNTADVNIDKREPVEIIFSNPNKLFTTDIGPSKLRVE